MSDREAILGRVRAALRDVPDEAAHAQPSYRRGRRAGADELAERFAERCSEYRANVTRCDAGGLAAAIAQACARHGARTLAVPAELPAEWQSPGIELRPDDPPLTADQLDGCDGVLTGCAAAIAETGTIALDSGPRQGRRALTLVPDLHICVVGAEQIHAGVPEGLAALDASIRAGRPVTLISGPSATSDIELKRVEGVHGPRRLEVLVVSA